MCFSAAASFAAAGTLGAAGGLTLVKIKKKSELPFASIPLLFGIQQAIEGAVWVSFGAPVVNTVATYAYSMFSHVLWPIFVPFSVLMLETDPTRKKILRLFSFIGLAIGLYLLYFIIAAPVTAQIVNQSIAYNSPHLYAALVMALYLVATCGSCLVSSHRIVNMFGFVLFVSFAVAAWFFADTFFSVWCFFAATLSIIAYWYFQSNSVGAEPGRSGV
ncbi:hypothetical protein A2851_00590 [Candidatus Kaiserbacteria bacterium RIFCSPHIGHO2_01_FULL_53_29]|uniref:Uncharacterized protein n=1 Tax=Candidatus Kaiserbacteria bacterium RIFCSPHIGHO2_01_FULL_53_29 TaxID=1798480 RepID=A0A1F6CUI8_9BACT|nr:MAG: hypothetical protein A2851_00590 [Candidatus Kaiserbacteria bacterium RIFCSPHIGHO2_01_FULL_53_29]